MLIATKKGLSFPQNQKYTVIKKGGKMPKEIVKNAKKPPFHQVVAAIFLGEFNDILLKFELLN
ncbi:MAG: hypothetical protein WC582_02645 [Patescibacteria group bacterium]